MQSRFRFLVLLLLVFALPLAADEIKDDEAATHAADASKYSVIETYKADGYRILQFDLPVLSHFSYLLVSDGDALLVDPGRDVFAYLAQAEQDNFTIGGVFLTHSHADFVAGHTEIAQRLQVPIHISAKAGAGYEHRGLVEGDTLEVGQAVIRLVETPGHTPDGMCAIVSNRAAPDQPTHLFSGDTLFIGSVGRPDLMGEGMAASTLASAMFDTWNGKLSKLPDGVVILPAHGAGSLCGAHLSSDPSATLGSQRVANPYLKLTTRGAFIASVLAELPQAPQYFKHNAAMNREGPPAARWEYAELPSIEPSKDLMDPAVAYVVDLRDAAAYAAGHVPNSVNIALRGRYETWTGIMVPWDSKVVLVGSEKEIREALGRLPRIGYEATCMTLEAWKAAGLPVTKSDSIEPKDLFLEMQAVEAPVVVDVRLPKEWMALRIGEILNIPLNELPTGAKALDQSQSVVAVCNSAYRSSLALGVLERLGFKTVANLKGGSQAWIDAGLPVFEARAPGATATTAQRSIKLAERVSAADLNRMMLDLPGTFTLVDIRPADQFADFHLPGSGNVDLADLMHNPAWLTGAGPLVIVDRDGSLAMMLAGILSQKTERPIKALYGGLQAYWAGSGPLGGAPAATPSATPGAAPAPQPAAPAPKKKARPSAGC